MLERKPEYPACIADGTDDDAVIEALRWFQERRDPESFTVWVPEKNTIRNNDILSKVANSPRCHVVTGRGSETPRGSVIAFYPDREDMGRFRSPNVTILAVITWSHSLNLWGELVGAELLSPIHERIDRVPPVSEKAFQEIESLTYRINLSNSITSLFEKRDTVRALESLRNSGCLPDERSAIELATAFGWREDNAKQLGEWVQRLHQGRKLRVR